MHHFKIFCIALVVFAVTDLFWLGYMANNYYFQNFANVMNVENGQFKPILWAGAMVYLFFSLAILIFVLPKANGSLTSALTYGALLGAVIYGIYDFTCLSLIKNWPLKITFVDLAWGTFLFAFSSVITTYFSRFIR